MAMEMKRREKRRKREREKHWVVGLLPNTLLEDRLEASL